MNSVTSVVRLAEKDQRQIKTETLKVFGEGAKVFVFGSRTRSEARGGDIDLLVESGLKDEEAFRAKLQLLAKLYVALGEQKIDIITTCMNEVDERLIVSNARRDGIEL